jgi:transglutaminase-like putative cysteine protease
MSAPAASTLSFQRPLGRLHGGLRDALLLALVASMTTWAALLSWKGFAVTWGGFMGPLVTVAVVVALSGAVLRWLRVPGPLVVLAQVVIVGAVVSLYICGSPLPIGDAYTRLDLAFQEASASAQQYSAPVPRGVPPIDPLLIAGGAACMLLVDIVVGTLRRVPLAGLPLLTVYSIPVSLLGGGVSWIVFTFTTIGFLLMLYLQESRQIARWGRPLGSDAISDPSGFGVSNGALRSSAAGIGAAATALAIVVPLFVPTLGLEVFSGGFGQGGGNQIKIVNPTTDLMRDLRRPQDYDMVKVVTDDPSPSYLRIAVLNRFSDNEWSSGDRTASSDQSATGELPPPAGLDPSVPTREFSYDVTISPDFISTWLPTQFPISAIQATGDWRYDLTTMDFMAFDDDLKTSGMSYSMTALQPTLSAEAMARSSVASNLMNTQFTDLPTDLPSSIRNTATTITADYPTRFQKAVAIQNWLRDNGHYTLQDAPSGNGSDTLEDFLNPSLDGIYLTGYCEQFAAAMAVMARTLNIPSRMAIGFLQPEQEADGSWVYSAWDLHAWPELYFPGSGWVRFEPTPPLRATSVPGYTQHEFPQVDPSDLPSTGATSDDILRPTVSDPKENNQQGQSADESGTSIPWRAIGLGVLVMALLVVLALLPRGLRRRRRARRLEDGAEPVWIELRDTVVDLGLTWPAGRSPRETGSHLVHYFGRPVGTDPAARPRHGADVAPEAEVALERIVGTIELQRYARPGSDQAAILKADAETVIGALEGGVTPGALRRATWLPRSLFVSRRRPTQRSSSNDEVTYTGVVDHVG